MDFQGNNLSGFFETNGHLVLQRVHNNHKLRSFTEKEIEHITDSYSTPLGNGSFGDVYKGTLDGQRPVAVKRYKNGANKEEFAKEVIVHSQINHKNVVRLLGFCTEENALMIVMEFICNGNLYNILHCSNASGPAPFPLDKRLDIAIQSAEALSCMHSMYSPVLHGDIKPANILLDENYLPKISDFGIARLLSTDEAQHTKNVIGCIGYVDPLFCQSGILTPKSDVYSFGVVLMEMITRKKAAGGNTNLTQCFTEALGRGKKLRQLFDVEIANDKKNMRLLEDIAKLAAKCLRMDNKMRPEMVEVADRLRMIRKALPQRKSESTTGSNARVPISGYEKNVPHPNNTLPAHVNASNKILTTVVPLPTIWMDELSDIPRNASSEVSPTVVPLPTISMDEVREITQNFSNDAFIGEGGYGRVFFAVLKDGQQCALKKLNPSNRIHFEVKVPSVLRLKHENVVQLLGYCVEGKDRVLAYEYASRGSLHNILHGKKGVKGAQTGAVLSWEQRIKIALSAAEGLEFLHEKAEPPVIHSRICSSNIFLFDDDVAKIGDAGFSKRSLTYREKLAFDSPYAAIHSAYDAPEYVLTKESGTKSDVYSFGIVLLELLTGREAVNTTRLSGQQKDLAAWASVRLHQDKVEECMDQRLEGNCNPKAVAKLARIMRDCWDYDPNNRPNMSTVVKALRPLLELTSCGDAPPVRG
ncbi:hypothetical protein QYE76_026678 [Lolium multiflorum]|uniref:Protein kinase domain-containing protein n=1 Tax=Lolium multiflorum TaxID=4521 RepID=A0AAD8RI91_LOLMU|nr:hypothetical protein QYE76_026678 [Lolium multiflorum]